MKSIALALILATLAMTKIAAQIYDETFTDNTLRVDYILAGNSEQQHVFIDRMSTTPQWGGRRVNMTRLGLKGNAQIEMRDAKTGTLIYTTSCSTLFHEWLDTPEAKERSKAFQNTVLLPYPRNVVDLTIRICDSRQKEIASLTQRIDPQDILIRHSTASAQRLTYTTHTGTDTISPINVVIVAEGYSEEHIGSFLADAKAATKALFDHEPFDTYKQHFNVTAVYLPSTNNGVSIPHKGLWIDTPLGSHFDTFYSDRYLTTENMTALHDALAGIAYAHIIVLANTAQYGGGGIYNAMTLTAAHHADFKPVVVHEFGHSFGGLADEYYYDELDTATYAPSAEPWEPNITTNNAVPQRWKELGVTSLNEGAGYSSKYVYRAYSDCRMKTNQCKEFCPVCVDALIETIKYNTVESDKPYQNNHEIIM